MNFKPYHFGDYDTINARIGTDVIYYISSDSVIAPKFHIQKYMKIIDKVRTNRSTVLLNEYMEFCKFNIWDKHFYLLRLIDNFLQDFLSNWPFILLCSSEILRSVIPMKSVHIKPNN